jgi:hypothetical protein
MPPYNKNLIKKYWCTSTHKRKKFQDFKHQKRLEKTHDSVSFSVRLFEQVRKYRRKYKILHDPYTFHGYLFTALPLRKCWYFNTLLECHNNYSSLSTNEHVNL